MGEGTTPFSGTLTLALAVRDRKASAGWYAAHLGCSLLYDVEEMGWCELSTPVGGVSLGLLDQEPVVIGGPTPTFGVSDLDGTREVMEAAGVSFTGPTIVMEGFVKLADFTDPDGHRLTLAQDLQGGEGWVRFVRWR